MARPLTITRTTATTTGPGLVLELHDRTGHCGRGEAAPLGGYSPDTLEECRAALDSLAVAELPLDHRLLPAIRDAVDALPATCPAARCAVDTALLSLAGQALARPVWQLLGGAATATIAINAVVDSPASAHAAVARGFTTLKVKLGRRPLDDELALARRLRRELGPDIALRFDANQRWPIDQARAALAGLAEIDPEYVEEPVPPADLSALRPSPVALAVDESLAGATPDFAMLRQLGVVVVVLKPMLLGGLLRCQALACAACDAGLEPVISHMLGGPIDLAAATQLGLAIGARRACGLARHPRLDAWPEPAISRPRGPRARADRNPGLGLAPPRCRLSMLAAAVTDPDRIALVVSAPRSSPLDSDLRAASYRFADLAAPVAATMTWLGQRGISGAATDRVAVLAQPGAATAILLYALFELGVTAVLIDPRLPAAEQKRRIDQVGATVAVDQDWQVPATEPRTVAATDRSGAAADVDPERALAVVFTSASSGVAKAVELSRTAWVAAADASATNLGWRDDDRWLICLPLAHVGGLAVLLRCLVDRRTAVVVDGFDVAHVIDTIAHQRITLLSLVPTMLDRLLEADWRPPPTLRAILLGGAAAPRTLLDQAARRDLPILTSYGMTETCGQIATQRFGIPTAAHRGVGPALPGVDLRIADDQAIQVRTPTLFTRYGPPLGTGPRVDGDGWFETGDRGCLDEAGNLHVLGRRDTTIVTGGDNVHPHQVEEILRGYPGIRDACVFGLPDPRWGEIVAAAVVGHYPVDLDGLAAFLASHLAGYQRPRRLFALPALPLGRNGKVDRAALVAAAARRVVLP